MRLWSERPLALGALPLLIPIPAMGEEAEPGAVPAVTDAGERGTVGATVVTPDIDGTEVPDGDPTIDDFSLTGMSFELDGLGAAAVCSALCSVDGVPAD